ncbi:phosphoglycerate mutase [Thiomicrospira cyclica]|uniref:2,3-bisphosphoglycerate-independent phosphoglycerate mutase n=1 Tax=Thiomicrospira cyclica (strain DSM 14477 / JCM 11371 / ALM1) TaxID=717773 RepID=F6DCA6_THICA|nr:phosphoglycerate mutase [Thiomicrospira cyclica]AEG31492.1 2,3-bisphosphoglycerate-independent phosphoglycerate mutase [Thiomicrospira cyclica ALM1]
MTRQSQALTLWTHPAISIQDVAEGLAALPKQRVAAWRKLLARGNLVPQKPKHFYAKAAYLMHQPAMPAIAATEASYQVLGFNEQDFWLKVSPIHLRPDRDTLVLIPETELAMTLDEAKALKFAFNRHFEPEGLQLEGTDQAWFLRLPQVIDFKSDTLDSLKFASMQGRYPTGASAGYWRRLMNEAQMLFHAHPVNERRRAEGQIEINSLWFWGEGQLNFDQIQPKNEMQIWSDHNYFTGLAKLTQAYQMLPVSDYATWLQQADLATSRHHLVHLSPPQFSHISDYLVWLEDSWLSPILAGLTNDELHSVYIDFDYSMGWLVEPRFLKRFWRRNIPFKMIK